MASRMKDLDTWSTSIEKITIEGIESDMKFICTMKEKTVIKSVL